MGALAVSSTTSSTVSVGNGGSISDRADIEATIFGVLEAAGVLRAEMGVFIRGAIIDVLEDLATTGVRAGDFRAVIRLAGGVFAGVFAREVTGVFCRL